MKAITVCQPWATLLIKGYKRFETRSWVTRYRGPILIHAGKKFPSDVISLCAVDPFRQLLQQAGYPKPLYLPLGAILGTMTLEACLTVDEAEKSFSAEDLESYLGDYRRGRYAWKMTNPQPLVVPLQYPGKLGIFDVPDHIFEKAAA
jgi:hypothetical protein